MSYTMIFIFVVTTVPMTVPFKDSLVFMVCDVTNVTMVIILLWGLGPHERIFMTLSVLYFPVILQTSRTLTKGLIDY